MHMKDTHAKRGYFKCSVLCCDMGSVDQIDTSYKREHETITKRKAPNAIRASRLSTGAAGGSRTHTVSLPADFESATSANSITAAYKFETLNYYTL